MSLGLGGAAIGAPQTVAHVTGVGEHPLLLRLVGLREMASGLGILAGRLTTGVLSRVAGDAMDLALLGAALRATAGPRHRRVVAATAVVAGITALDVLASRRRLEADRFPH